MIESQKNINLILANDHSILRGGIKAGLRNHGPSLEFLAEPENFQQLFVALNEFPETEVLLTDDVMPLGNIKDALLLIRDRFPSLKIIVTTMHADIKYIKSLIPLSDGVISYINATEECSKAIQTVLNGGIYFTFPGVGDMSSQKTKIT